MIDYKQITNDLQIEKVEKLLWRLGAENVVNKGDYLITNTICHNSSGGSSKLYYYNNNHLFYCYTHCEAMSIFTFLINYYNAHDIVYDWYEDVYKVVISCTSGKDFSFEKKKEEYKRKSDKYKINQIEQLLSYNSSILNVFSHYYPIEWLNDGITKEAIDKFNIKYSITQNKIIIPHYDVNGRLVGIRGRALNQEEVEEYGKYTPIKIENKWYTHKLSLNLYGLNFNLKNIKKNKVCYIFESEKAVLQCEKFNRDNCAVAVCGSNFNKFQLKLLLKYCQPQEIIICFDKEEKHGEDKYFNKLLKICKKYNKYCNFSFIYDNENLLELKDSPSDKGEQVFNRLLEKRIRVN